MATFSSEIQKAVLKPIVLFEVTPRQQLSNWTQQGGLTYTYYVNYEINHRPSVGGDAIYRPITDVFVDNSKLTECTDEDGPFGVTNTPGGWYYKPSDGRLYVHTSGDTDPDDETVVFARFRLHFATIPGVYDDVYYDGRILEDNFPAVTKTSEELMFGIEKRVGSGEIHLSNGDGLFDSLGASWIWKNAEADIYIGTDELIFHPGGVDASAVLGEAVLGPAILGEEGDAGFKYVGRFGVESMTPNVTAAEVVLRDMQEVSLQKIPIEVITPDTSGFANADPSVYGQRLPLVYGVHAGVPGHLIDTASQKGKYAFCSNNYQNVYEFTTFYNDGVVISVSDRANITENLLQGTIRFDTAYSGTTPGTVTCDMIGMPVRGHDYETSTDYLKYYGEIICELYYRLLDVEVVDISAQHALDADKDGIPQNVFISDLDTARKYIRKIEAGVLGRTFVNSNGKLCPTIFGPSSATTVSTHIADPDVKSFSVTSDTESVFSRCQVQYDPQLDGTFTTKGYTNLYSEYLMFPSDSTIQGGALLVADTFLKNAGDASALASRLTYISRLPRTDVVFEEAGIKLMDKNVGDLIRLTLSRAPSSTGSWDEKTVMISKIVKKLGPVPSTIVTVNDLEGLGSELLVGKWSAVGTTWSLATPAEKAVTGWWSDTNGYVDPADKSTKNISVWW